MQFNFPLLINSIGIGFSLILAFVFFKRSKSQIYLGVIFFAVFLSLFEEFFWLSNHINEFIHVAEIAAFAPFLIPPSLYLYSKSLSRENINTLNILHYIPALLIFINFSPFYFSGTELKTCYIIEEITNTESSICKNLLQSNVITIISDKITDILNIFQFILYLILSIPFLKEMLNTKSNKVQSKFNDWSNLLIGLTALAIIFIVIDLLFINQNYDFFSVFYLTFISVFVVFRMLDESLFLGDHLKANNYKAVTNIEVKNIVSDLKQYIEQDEVYQDTKMSIEKASASLNLPRNKIAHALKVEQIDFKDILNQRRINKAKQLLQNSPEFTIEAIGKEVGYSSKATFYKYFKKYEGITPSQFLANT